MKVLHIAWTLRPFACDVHKGGVDDVDYEVIKL